MRSRLGPVVVSALLLLAPLGIAGQAYGAGDGDAVLAGSEGLDAGGRLYDVVVAAPSAPTDLSLTPDSHAGTGTITWSTPTSAGTGPVTGYRVTGVPGAPYDFAADEHLFDVTGLVPGTTYDVVVRAENVAGLGDPATGTLHVDTWAPTTKPGLSVTLSGTAATLRLTAPENPGRATLTGWTVHQVGPGARATDEVVGAVTTTTVTGLAIGTHTFTVTASYAADDTAGIKASDPRSVVVPTKPSAPKIGRAASGASGGTKSATATWSAPSSSGGSAVTGYQVYAYKVVRGKASKTYTSSLRPSSARSYAYVLPAGAYKFRVVAINKVGTSPYSGYSKVVAAR
ncbi:MAG: hypothetical protein JWQ74_2896 [Marmoricola sp.]|nr:hypothetical protein [Marmoricola sp.]